MEYVLSDRSTASRLGWIGFAFGLATTAFVVVAFLALTGPEADPNNPAQRDAEGCLRPVLYVCFGAPALILSFITCGLGLISLVGCIRDQRNLFAPIATLALSVVSFVLLASVRNGSA